MNEDIPHLHERVTASRLLSTTAAEISGKLDAFCNWLLLGVGAAYTLVFSHWAELRSLIAPCTLQISLALLLAAIVVGIFQRWLAAMVASSFATSEKSSQVGAELAARGIEVDFAVVFSEMERGLFYPAKWIARSSFKKAVAGDLAAGGRLAAYISQIQSWLAFALVGLVVAAVAVTVSGVKV
ncbi:hypothetical protein [Rhodanobacter sp. T12-5]|uniref:hypothetical protein n=1 Tax=Rhodanobacter sp. T12-5 TaxID=2024611 RepID=UPI0011EDCBC8|nr:hypothetical protein [Rhodanobacter sp. T12-5]